MKKLNTLLSILMLALTLPCANAYDITVSSKDGQRFTASVDEIEDISFETPASPITFTGEYNNEIKTGVGAHDISIEFDASMYWIIASKEDDTPWMRLSRNYGLSGANVLTVSLDANKVQAPRTATFTVMCGFNLIEFSVTQSPDETGQTVDMPDAAFSKYILDNFDTDKDGVLTADEAARITNLDLREKGITTLSGIRQMPNLETLDCSYNEIAGTLDLSGLSKLTVVKADHNKYECLILNDCTSLEEVYANDNWIYERYRYTYVTKEVQVGGCSSLRLLQLEDNAIETLDLSDCTALTDLMLAINNLKSIDLTKCSSLVNAHIRRNPMNGATIDLSGCPELKTVNFSENNAAAVNFGTISKVEKIDAQYNNLTTIDLSSLPELKELTVFSNQLTSLDLSNNPQLTSLWASTNPLSSIDTSNNTKLATLNISGCQISGTLDLTANPLLYSIEVSNNAIEEVKLTGTPNLNDASFNKNKLTSLDLSGAPRLLTLVANNNLLTSVNLSGCDGLTIIDLDDNKLTDINLSGFGELRELGLANNELTKLDLSGCEMLGELIASGNKLAEINVKGLGNLTRAELFNNCLTEIDLTGLKALDELHIHYNKLKTFEPAKATVLRYVDIRSNAVDLIDFSSNHKLQYAFGTGMPTRAIWLSEQAPNNQIQFDEKCKIFYGAPTGKEELDPLPQPVAKEGYSRITSLDQITTGANDRYLIVVEEASGIFAVRQTSNFHEAAKTEIADHNIAPDADNVADCQLTVGHPEGSELFWFHAEKLGKNKKPCYIECMNNFGGSPAKVALFDEDHGETTWLWAVSFDDQGNLVMKAHPVSQDVEGDVYLGYEKSGRYFALYGSDASASDYAPVQLYKLSAQK